MSVLSRPTLGPGNHQKLALAWVMERGLRIAVMLDASGQQAPELVAVLVAPLLSGDAAAVVGAMPPLRASSGAERSAIARRRIHAGLHNLRGGMKLSDWRGGYRAYDTDRLDGSALDAMSDGQDFEVEILQHLARRRQRIVEVPLKSF